VKKQWPLDQQGLNINGQQAPGKGFPPEGKTEKTPVVGVKGLKISFRRKANGKNPGRDGGVEGPDPETWFDYLIFFIALYRLEYG
jgi:hypothetical protein